MSRVELLPGRKRPLVFAHRGCSSLAPENTMAAFRKARDLGSPGIELDVYACATGEVIVAHDDTFKRFLPAGAEREVPPRKIEEMSLAEIRSIDVGSFFDPAFSAERPPLLEEVLTEFCPDMYVDIELKTRKIKGDSLPALLAGLLKRLDKKIQGSVTVSSFNPIALAVFKRFLPGIPTAVIWSEDPEVPLFLRHGFGRFIARCDYVKPDSKLISTAACFRWAQMEGRPVVPGTVNDKVKADRLIAFGCEGIVTNKPQEVCW
jgi:glycerophosphoryl diester phosphodiesterase